MTSKPTITQADHDAFESAAIPLLEAMRNNNSNISEIIVEAFAKHRESSVAELKVEVERLRVALRMAANQFRYYEENHQLKGTPDGVAKAETNRRLAEQCEAALNQKEPGE